MKSLKLIGLSLLALFALGVFAAASASAEEGFLPTPTTANVLGGESVLATEAFGSEIKCGKLDASTITFSNDKHATGTLHWLECTLLGSDIHSLGAKAKEILVAISFLGCLDPKSGATLVDEFGVSGEVQGTAHLEAPALGVLVEVAGAALGAVLTKGKAKLFSVEFKGSKGKQTVTECLEGANKKVHNLIASTNHGEFKPASENVVGGLVQFTKEVELEDS
jgi:hypothetical protein